MAKKWLKVAKAIHENADNASKYKGLRWLKFFAATFCAFGESALMKMGERSAPILAAAGGRGSISDDRQRHVFPC